MPSRRPLLERVQKRRIASNRLVRMRSSCAGVNGSAELEPDFASDSEEAFGSGPASLVDELGGNSDAVGLEFWDCGILCANISASSVAAEELPSIQELPAFESFSMFESKKMNKSNAFYSLSQMSKNLFVFFKDNDTRFGGLVKLGLFRS